MVTRRKWYSQDFLAESQKLLERRRPRKDAGFKPPVLGTVPNITNTPVSPGYRLLRRQSTRNQGLVGRRGLSKTRYSYCPRGRNLGRAEEIRRACRPIYGTTIQSFP
ncbi:hypothetical protein TNCV_2443491 [Trichonephila clavipes]|nr:hypothetical protein TNCV_2443491 [Trichonephila clavipes]